MKVTPQFISGLMILFLIMVTSSQSPESTVLTKSGPIQGSGISIFGLTVYQFLGIPYAQPPLGELRFKKPQSIRPWSMILEANLMPPACIQYSDYPFPWYDFELGKSEDCLYLNVWVPEDKGDRRTKKAVMFWIHSGYFVQGSSRLPVYDGKALAAVGDVIVVTINYRLGAFGFFTTNTDEAPFNVAMYDMLEALKWVNKNIEAFGGDPNQVTLFGEGAGSTSIGLFCLSPLTEGLFSRVIMESASPPDIQYDNNTSSLLMSEKLAKAVGCANPPTTSIFTTPNEVVKCMRGKDAFEIAKTLNSFNPSTGITYMPTYGDAFLPKNPRKAIETGKIHNVSVFIGIDRDEGSQILTTLTTSDIDLFGFYGEKLPTLYIPYAERRFKDIVENTLKNVPNTYIIKQIILSRLIGNDFRKHLNVITDFLGDIKVVCPVVNFAESYRRYGNQVFFFSFEHRPSTTPWAEWMGVVHFDEVQFVFGYPLLYRSRYTQEEVELSTFIMKTWSNFAKRGNPALDISIGNIPFYGGPFENILEFDRWPSYSREMPLYSIIDYSTTKVKQYKFGPHKENCDLFRPVFGFP